LLLSVTCKPETYLLPSNQKLYTRNVTIICEFFSSNLQTTSAEHEQIFFSVVVNRLT